MQCKISILNLVNCCGKKSLSVEFLVDSKSTSWAVTASEPCYVRKIRFIVEKVKNFHLFF